jgi:hypothetical protein
MLRARSRADELDAIDEADKLLLHHRYVTPRQATPTPRYGLDARELSIHPEPSGGAYR